MSVNRRLNQSKKKALNKLKFAARYSGLAFEMFFPILAGVFGGIKLDKWLNTGALFTVVLSLIGVFSALYLALKDILKKNGE